MIKDYLDNLHFSYQNLTIAGIILSIIYWVSKKLLDELWNWKLKKWLKHFGEFLINLCFAFSKDFEKDIYTYIGSRPKNDGAQFLSFMAFIGILIFCLSNVLTFSVNINEMANRSIQGQKIVKLEQIAKTTTNPQEREAINLQLKEILSNSKQKLALTWIFITIIMTVGIGHKIFKMWYCNYIIQTFDKMIMLIRPEIGDKHYHIFMSRFAMLKSKQDLADLISDIKLIGKLSD